VKLPEEIFENTSSCPTDEQVRSYHIGVERDPEGALVNTNFLAFLKSYVSFV
jgi:hypothetical protein